MVNKHYIPSRSSSSIPALELGNAAPCNYFAFSNVTATSKLKLMYFLGEAAAFKSEYLIF